MNVEAVDYLPVLRCAEGKCAVKTITPTDVVDFDSGYKFRVEMWPLGGLGCLFKALVKLRDMPDAFVVSGRLRQEREGKEWHRRHYLDRAATADQPARTGHFEGADRRWMCADLDNVLVDDALRERVALLGVTELEPALRAALPPELRDASCVVQFSSRAGFDGWRKAKAHLWFWVDRAVYCKSWNAWFKASDSPVDQAPFQPVQPHYTSDPILKGVANPIPANRVYLSLREPACAPREVVDLATWREQERAAIEECEVTDDFMKELLKRQNAAIKGSAGAMRQQEAYARGALNSAVSRILECGEGSRHDTIRDEAWATYRFVTEGTLPESAWANALERAGIQALGDGRADEVRRLIRGAKR